MVAMFKDDKVAQLRAAQCQELNLMAVLAVGQRWDIAAESLRSPSKDWRGKTPPDRVTIKEVHLRERAIIVDGWNDAIDPEFFARGFFVLRDEAPAQTKEYVVYRRLPALSVAQPWAWAIFGAGKNVENRSWAPPDELLRGWIWIHASKQFDRNGQNEIVNRGIPMPRVTLFPMGRVIGAVKVIRAAERYPSVWFKGPIGWVLEDPQALPLPVKVDGNDRLWVPDLNVGITG